MGIHAPRSLVVTAAAALAAAGLAGAAQAGSTTVVTTKSSSLGTILVTSAGRTLYLDTRDKPPKFACTGACLSAWPPLKAVGSLKAAGSAKRSLLGTSKGPAGKVVTYAGHPWYTFASDSRSRPTSGEGVNGFYAVSPSGTKVTSHKFKPPSGGQGY
jgi:predicted lipoprotein with Yx(FWY)xxD motif